MNAEDAHVDAGALPGGMLALEVREPHATNGVPGLAEPAPWLQDPASRGSAASLAVGPSGAPQQPEAGHCKGAEPALDEAPSGSGRRVGGHPAMGNELQAEHGEEDQLTQRAACNGPAFSPSSHLEREESGLAREGSAQRLAGGGSPGEEPTVGRAQSNDSWECLQRGDYPAAHSHAPVHVQLPGMAGVGFSPKRPRSAQFVRTDGSSAREGCRDAITGGHPSSVRTHGGSMLGSLSAAACSLPTPPARSSLQPERQVHASLDTSWSVLYCTKCHEVLRDAYDMYMTAHQRIYMQCENFTPCAANNVWCR